MACQTHHTCAGTLGAKGEEGRGVGTWEERGRKKDHAQEGGRGIREKIGRGRKYIHR